MARLFPRVSKRAGLPSRPAAAGEREPAPAGIHAIAYGPGVCEESRPARAEECFPLPDPPLLAWINVDGLHDTTLLQAFADRLGLHPLRTSCWSARRRRCCNRPTS